VRAKKQTNKKMSSNLKLLKSVSISELVYTQIHETIMSGEVMPGEHVNEHKLAAAIGVSRATIREACRKLEKDGLIEIAKNRGPFVRDLLPEEAIDLYDVRSALEALAAELAAHNRSDNDIRLLEQCVATLNDAIKCNDESAVFATAKHFHELIYAAAANESLTEAIASVAGRITLFRLKFITTSIGEPDATEEEEILEAIRIQDGARASTLMRDHILQAKKKVHLVADELRESKDAEKVSSSG